MGNFLESIDSRVALETLHWRKQICHLSLPVSQTVTIVYNCTSLENTKSEQIWHKDMFHYCSCCSNRRYKLVCSPRTKKYSWVVILDGVSKNLEAIFNFVGQKFVVVVIEWHMKYFRWWNYVWIILCTSTKKGRERPHNTKWNNWLGG